MKFAIITHAFHKKKEDKFYAYEPYVREMNLWLKNVNETKILAPLSFDMISEIDENYKAEKISLIKIPYFDITSISNSFKSLFLVPIILIRIFKVMLWADHIHLRCPGNVGLLGCFVQILFPNKPKTVKYAGNWDPKSKQPWSYRLQKWIVSNTFLTRNCKVLVYGEWENQTKNIVPFFTASYFENEIEEVQTKELNQGVNFIFVGAFSVGKQPLTSIRVVESLHRLGKKVSLDMYGDGQLFNDCKEYISANNLQDVIFLQGNKSKETVKKAFQKAHFLIFISKSEGWPKVVAEAMFWSCLPISTAVSCVPSMLGNGIRGSIVNEDVSEITSVISTYFNHPNTYQDKILEAKSWSQNYTLDKFEFEIKKLLK